MIRRKKIQNTQTTSIDRQEQPRLSFNNRKEGQRNTNRFSYQLQNLNTDNEQNQSVVSRTKYLHQYSIHDRQTTHNNQRDSTVNKSIREVRNAPLKKDHLYQENNVGSLYRSSNKTNNYQRYNSSIREDILNTSHQYETTPFNRTPIFTSLPLHATVDQFITHQQNIEQQYEQIWENNQRQKQCPPSYYSTMRHPLGERPLPNRQNIVINKRHSISKNIKQERSASLRSQQNHQPPSTYRHYIPTNYFEVDTSLQTRKTSPVRHREKLTEQITLRSSPNKPLPSFTQSRPFPKISPSFDEAQVNIRLIEQFNSRVQVKIQELSSMLVLVKCIK